MIGSIKTLGNGTIPCCYYFIFIKFIIPVINLDRGLIVLNDTLNMQHGLHLQNHIINIQYI